jgi:hypothetical protein
MWGSFTFQGTLAISGDIQGVVIVLCYYLWEDFKHATKERIIPPNVNNNDIAKSWSREKKQFNLEIIKDHKWDLERKW